MIVTVAGVSGRIGRLLTEHLLDFPDVQIHGLCRTPSKLPSRIREHSRFRVWQADCTQMGPIAEALQGASVAACCYLGGPDVMVNGQKALIDACIQAKVPRFAADDWCLNFFKLADGDHPVEDGKKHVDAYLKERSHQIQGVSVMIGSFMDWLVTTTIWDPQHRTLRYWGSGDEIWQMTTYDDCARFAAQVIHDEKAVGNFQFRGDQLSIRQMATVFQKVYGFTPRLECVGSLEDLHSDMTTKLKEEPNNIMAWLDPSYFYYIDVGKLQMDRKDNDRYPTVHPLTFQEFLSQRSVDQLKTADQF